MISLEKIFFASLLGSYESGHLLSGSQIGLNKLEDPFVDFHKSPSVWYLTAALNSTWYPQTQKLCGLSSPEKRVAPSLLLGHSKGLWVQLLLVWTFNCLLSLMLSLSLLLKVLCVPSSWVFRDFLRETFFFPWHFSGVMEGNPHKIIFSIPHV